MQNKIIKRSKQNTNVRNLLDNSDFRNPVNQRGQNSYTKGSWGGYTIDRWAVGSGTENTVNIVTDGVSVKGGIIQWLEDVVTKALLGKKVTCAAKVNSAVYVLSGVVPDNTEWTRISTVTFDGGNVTLGITAGKRFEIAITCATQKNIEWAALYEGEYTAETLPEYQPKGYGAELAECQRYYIKISSNSWTYCAYPNGTGFAIATIPTKYPMRVTPQVTGKCSIFADLGWINDLIPRIENTITGYNIIITPDTSNMTAGKVYIICGEIELNADL